MPSGAGSGLGTSGSWLVGEWGWQVGGLGWQVSVGFHPFSPFPSLPSQKEGSARLAPIETLHSLSFLLDFASAHATCHVTWLDYNRRMPTRKPDTRHKLSSASSVLAAIVLAVIGWAGLVYLINNVHADLRGKVAFLGLWSVALGGTAFPVILALHRRFLSEPSPWTILRQSAWVGAFGTLAAWLQMNRVLNVATAALVAGVFVVLEVILSWRARQETPDD